MHIIIPVLKTTGALPRAWKMTMEVSGVFHSPVGDNP
jgi:hypothetical protein